MASSTGANGSSNQARGSGSSPQDYVVRIPKTTKRRFHVMRFLQSRQQTVSEWTQVRMERENNMKEYRTETDELPKHGAGSEYGRDLKEEARRKKFGIVRKKYNPDDQPWMLNVGGKHGKKFKGVREGGVMANASYYVFSKAPDGIFEAYPVDEWYNFTPVQRFKALTAEEAEDAFSQRDRIINHFAIMINKRMAEAQGQTVEEEKEEKTSSKKSRASLQISDMDEWVGDSDFSAGSEEEEDTERKKKKRKNEKKKDKKNQESDSSAKEESDEGDFDDREVDYMTSGSGSSDEEPEDAKANKQLKGVEDEDALRQLVLSDEEEEDEEQKKEEGEEDNKNGEDDKNAASKDGANKDEKEKKSKSSDESSSESSDSDLDDQIGNSALFMQGKKKDGNGSRSGTPTKEVAGKKGKAAAAKRKKESTPTKEGALSTAAGTSATDTPAPKKPKIELNLGGSASNMPAGTLAAQQSPPLSQIDGINEESIRRYLMRKPMTTTELLQKFKSKKTGLSSQQLVDMIAQILKRLNPEKQKINEKLYLSIKQ
ncbi:general transcription factor IIF subunit 1 [Galendromus occidentalis]|uniref:Transcription initiation factor IIF subunit alpha n=1 Tax=Galendromus occidentalis TaxID=34638 RepID=A0AAJ7L3W2_9ACAR|nr:general transcription factor IIF subunit 1 [Galendromus occidentalis]